MEDKINTKGKVSYCGITNSKFLLPNDLSSFKDEFIKQFGLSDQMKPEDITSIKFNDDKIDDEPSYKDMLKEISKKDIIYVKTEKVPIKFKGANSIDFEEEIKNVIERELKIAANNIKEGLTKHFNLSNCKKVRKEECSKCQKQIFGYLFKKVIHEKDDEYYCELCSTQVEEPMFKIY